MEKQTKEAMKWSSKAENKAEGWLKGAPHLPKEAQKWLAKNSWWLVAIGAGLSAISILTMLNSLFVSSMFISTYYGAWGGSGLWTARTLIQILFMVLVVVISLMAIKPLRAMSKKGWDFLFLAFLVSAVSSVVTTLISYNPFSAVFSLVFVAIFATIGAWLLFEIRGYFKKTHTKSHSKAHTTVKK